MNWRERPDWRVYLVTDRELCLGRPLEDVVLRAVAGGATMVQLREKEASSRDFLALTRLLVRELHGRGVPLVVNDRADIALAGGAAGLHVGRAIFRRRTPARSWARTPSSGFPWKTWPSLRLRRPGMWTTSA